jgi:hypothetical protein
MLGGWSLELLGGVAGVVIVVVAGTLLATRKGVAVEPAANRPES